MGRIVKKHHSTIQGGNSNLPIELLINKHTQQQKIKNSKSSKCRNLHLKIFHRSCFSNIKGDTIPFPDYSLQKTKFK